MNGLEQILLKIENDSNEKIEKIIFKAEEEKENIISSATDEANMEAQLILKEAKDKEQRIRENAQNSYNTEKRAGVLRAKTAVMDKWLLQAEKEFLKINDKEYFGIIKKLILKYADSGEGEIIFSKEDNEKIKGEVLKEVNKELSLKNASVTLSKETLDIGKGFVIRYGMIEENCSFKALIEHKKEELKERLFVLLNDVGEV